MAEYTKDSPFIPAHDPLCELVTQADTGIRRGWVCSCREFADVRADERRKISEEIADGALRKVFQGAEDRGYKKASEEWKAIGIDQWDLAWASGELKARITARARFEEACETVGREELTLQEIITVLNGGTLPDPLFHDYDGHNSCTRCGQKAYNSGAEGPCPNHPNHAKES